jgi:hypothetical protein
MPKECQGVAREINSGLDDPRIKTRIADLGATVFRNSPVEFGAFIAVYTEKWPKVIRAANIKAERLDPKGKVP